jgi:uncharacterized protein YdeI (YjbR/CyaY-like superfamily)
MKTAIFLPADIVRKLPPGRIRMEGTINGAFFALAVQNLRDGSRYFSVGAPLRKAARIEEGDKVKVICKIVDPDKVDLPEELEAVLEQDELARKTWDELTTGFQRSLVHYITSVKNVDSRINRALDLINRAKAGLLQGQKKARRSKK